MKPREKFSSCPLIFATVTSDASICTALLSRSTYFANKGLWQITRDKESINGWRSRYKLGCPLLLLPPVLGSGRGREVVGGNRGEEGDASERSPCWHGRPDPFSGLNTINAALSCLERNKIARPKCLGVLK